MYKKADSVEGIEGKVGELLIYKIRILGSRVGYERVNNQYLLI